MVFKFRSACVRLLFPLPILFGITTGCDQARDSLAAAIKPKTVEDVTSSVNEKLARKDYVQARTEGAEYLKGKDDATGKLAWALAKACAQTGDVDLAVMYAGQAIKANAATPAEVLNEPLLEPIRYDIRFVKLLTSTAAPDAMTTKPTASTSLQQEMTSTSSTSVTLDSNGVEARAGDIAVKLPN